MKHFKCPVATESSKKVCKREGGWQRCSEQGTRPLTACRGLLRGPWLYRLPGPTGPTSSSPTLPHPSCRHGDSRHTRLRAAGCTPLTPPAGSGGAGGLCQGSASPCSCEIRQRRKEAAVGAIGPLEAWNREAEPLQTTSPELVGFLPASPWTNCPQHSVPRGRRPAAPQRGRLGWHPAPW